MISAAPRGSSLLLRALAVGAALLLASGCASTPAVTVPKEVRVPVPVPCVDPAQRPKPPAVLDENALLAMPPGTRTLRLWADHQRLRSYVPQLEAVVEGCSRIPAGG